MDPGVASSGLWAPWNEGDGNKAGCSRVIGQKGGRVSRHPYLVQSSNSTPTIFGAWTVPSDTEKDAHPLGGHSRCGLVSGHRQTVSPTQTLEQKALVCTDVPS